MITPAESPQGESPEPPQAPEINPANPLADTNRAGCGCNRRWFLRVGLVGATVWPLLGKAQPVLAEAHQAQALVLSCMDFRMVEAEQQFLAQKQLGHRYDWVALAGASLALAGFPHVAEAETFWDQLEISQQLHHINRVIILDHQDCGAYASRVDPALSQDPQREQQIHAAYLNQAYRAITAKYPDLSVELYFLGLDGTGHPVLPTSA